MGVQDLPAERQRRAPFLEKDGELERVHDSHDVAATHRGGAQSPRAVALLVAGQDEDSHDDFFFLGANRPARFGPPSRHCRVASMRKPATASRPRSMR